jgi:hypothetical protein
MLAALHWLPTADALWLVVICAPLGLLARRARTTWVTGAGAVLRELAITLGLYALWGLAGEHATVHIDAALRNGRSIWHFERWLHLPSELTLQHAALHHEWLVKAANFYYAFAHVPSLITFLVWLFVFHRAQYSRLRNALAYLTGSCLLIQMIPVAPPRLLPELGFVDTALRFHQSVYPPVGGGGPDQFSAMPSLHIGWAALIAFGVIVAGTGRRRALILVHLVLTFLAIVVTANHFWLDGVASIGLLAAAVGLARLTETAVGVVRIRVHRTTAAGLSPVQRASG